MSRKAGELRFKEGLDRLESVVKALEGDTLELEEAIERYEEGLGLYRRLVAVLADAEKRVEILSGEKGGRPVWKRFQSSGVDDEAEGAADGS